MLSNKSLGRFQTKGDENVKRTLCNGKHWGRNSAAGTGESIWVFNNDGADIRDFLFFDDQASAEEAKGTQGNDLKGRKRR